MTLNPVDHPLHRVAAPRSLAMFGASNNLKNMGSMILGRIIEHGYPGAIYPLHPKEDTVQGYRAYKRPADLPEPADLAVLVLPSKLVPEVLDECGRAGIKAAIVVSGGFQEVGAEGAAMQEQMKEIAQRHGMRFMGPNCLGVCNPHAQLNTTPLPYDGKPGFIGLASQSGSFVTQMYDYMSRHAMGFSTAFSVGNQANVDLVDCLEYLGADPATKVIGLYVESITRGREFVRLAREISLRKPIVAYYVGGSETGRRAALSHTGALAGPDKLYDGIFAQSGVVRADTISEMFDICWAMGALPLPRGNGVAIMTDSGGPGAAGADAAERAGLRVPPLSARTIEGLQPLIPPTASAANPVDVTFPREYRLYYKDLPEIILGDEDISALMVYWILPVNLIAIPLTEQGISLGEARKQAVEITRSLYEQTAKLIETTGKPIVAYSFNSLEKEPLQTPMRLGLPVYPTPQRAARALAAMDRYRHLRDKIARQDTPA